MQTSKLTNNLRLGRLEGVAALVVGLAILAGCGGSSTPKISTQKPRPTPLQSNADAGPAQTQVGHREESTGSGRRASGAVPAARRGAGQSKVRGRNSGNKPLAHVHGGTPKVHAARPTPAVSEGDPHSGAVGRSDPCALVSVGEASSITGQPIAGQTEAPLGPTCIYRLARSKAEITLAVESINFAQTTRHMTKQSRVTVAGRGALCGQLGSQILLVPLRNGRVLNVTAPCTIGVRFASKALSRLAA